MPKVLPQRCSATFTKTLRADVYAGTDAYDNHLADCIVGIGGGAGLDVARAILLRINHREDLFEGR